MASRLVLKQGISGEKNIIEQEYHGNIMECDRYVIGIS